MKLQRARAAVFAVMLLAGWLATACSQGAKAPEAAYPDPAKATGPYTLVYFTASW